MEGLDTAEILAKAKQRYERVAGKKTEEVDTASTEELLKAKTLILGRHWPD